MLKFDGTSQVQEYGTTQIHRLGEVCVAPHATFGYVSAIYVKLDVNVAIQGAPLSLYQSSGVPDGTVEYDENGTGALGQHLTLGALAYGGTLDASSTTYYVWIQQYGLSLPTMTMTANTSAQDLIFPSTTDGKWVNEAGISESGTSSAAVTFEAYNLAPHGVALADDNSSNVMAAGKVFLSIPWRIAVTL